MTSELLLLRHGEVESHRGDVPVTTEGLQTAAEVGAHLAARATGRRIRIVSGETRRTRDTAEAVARGAVDGGADVVTGGVAFALRNPDLYLAGVRVNMVSSEQAFAEQVPGLAEADIGKLAFFRDWLSVPDRVGWWVAHENPPGDTAADVARRIERFAASFADRPGDDLVVGVTHSPVLRALAVHCTGTDPGEPAWLAGIAADVADDRSVTFRVLDEAP
jgi:broad specificity phosphatase PhoE